MQPSLQRPLPPDEIARLHTVAAVCDVLRGWGRPDLADRIAYFASDADLDDGDVPVTLASALGFLAFFGAVESAEGKVDLGCSPEGWLCADWRFPDNRIVALWFLDRDRVMYAARKADGYFANINNGSEIGSRLLITEKLVGMAEWFRWFRKTPVAASSNPRTM